MCLRTLLLVMGVTLMFQPKRLQAQSSRYVTCSHRQFPVNNKPWYFLAPTTDRVIDIVLFNTMHARKDI